MTELVSLDSESCFDASTCGDKAARLARARASGFPVLPGFVVPMLASKDVLANAVATSDGNFYHARLTVMDADVSELRSVVAAARALAKSVVVRSSSPVEGSGQWAGAFTSYVGIEPESILTAVRGVWASAITDRATQGTDGGSIGMAVLVQPEVLPQSSGTARVEPDGTVAIVTVRGSPAALMTGWSRGATARIRGTGSIDGDAAVATAGREALVAVARLITELREATGDDVIEWAALDDSIVLLQCREGDKHDAASRDLGAEVAPLHGLLPIARHLYSYAGPLGDDMVLPWLVAGKASLAVPPASWFASPPVSDDAGSGAARAAWARAQVLADELKSQIWAGNDNDPADTLRALRGEAPASALSRLEAMPTADADDARRLLTCAGTVAARFVRVGLLRSAREFWLLTPDEVSAMIEGPSGAPTAAVLDRRLRRAALRWEPLVFAAVMTDGWRAVGEAAAPGIGAGLTRLADDMHEPPPGSSMRYVVVARHPLPRFAPLLWAASGLVTVEGSPGAHLVEVANSLGIPAIVGCADAERVLRGEGGLAAVDGYRGTVAFASQQGHS